MDCAVSSRCTPAGSWLGLAAAVVDEPPGAGPRIRQERRNGGRPSWPVTNASSRLTAIRRVRELAMRPDTGVTFAMCAASLPNGTKRVPACTQRNKAPSSSRGRSVAPVIAARMCRRSVSVRRRLQRRSNRRSHVERPLRVVKPSSLPGSSEAESGTTEKNSLPHLRSVSCCSAVKCSVKLSKKSGTTVDPRRSCSSRTTRPWCDVQAPGPAQRPPLGDSSNRRSRFHQFSVPTPLGTSSRTPSTPRRRGPRPSVEAEIPRSRTPAGEHVAHLTSTEPEPHLGGVRVEAP
jgi:hypothetical protein